MERVRGDTPQRARPSTGDHFEAAHSDFDDTAEKIVADLRREPDAVRVSVAIAWLYEELNEIVRSHAPRLWSDSTAAPLPYEADDLELALDLIGGVDIGWVFAPELVRAIERFAAKSGSFPDGWRDPLRALLARMAGARDATYQKAAATIRSLLGTSGSDSARLDLSSLDGSDAWSTTARERLGKAYGEDGRLNPLVGMLQDSGTAPRPGPKWRKQIGAALEESPSSGDALRVLLETAIEVRDELVQRVSGGTWLTARSDSRLPCRSVQLRGPLSCRKPHGRRTCSSCWRGDTRSRSSTASRTACGSRTGPSRRWRSRRDGTASSGSCACNG